MEKEELLKIVERLWRQERNDKEMLEKMEDDSLCKICMDAPVSAKYLHTTQKIVPVPIFQVL